MKSKLLFFVIIIAFFSCNNINKSKNPNREKEIIKQTIHNTIAWAKEKDTALLYSIIANDENYLEVHPRDDKAVGITQFKQAEQFWLDDRFKHIRYETWDMHINLSEDGTVSWYYCRLNDINEWNGQAASWENARWTGVLEKRRGKWRMVQMHFSYPSK